MRPRRAGAGPVVGGEAVFYKPPLLPYLLSLPARLFGPEAGPARLFLLLLSALAAPLTARLARPPLGRWGALLAGAFVALYAPAVFYGAELLAASTVLLLNLFLLLLLRRAEERGRRWAYFGGGVALGLSALARPTIGLLLPFLLFRYRRARTAGLMLLAGAALGIAPATLHNLRGGDFVLVSSNGGINFYLGNHAGADGRSATSPGLPNEPGAARRAARSRAGEAAGRDLSPSAVSRFWYGRGVAWIVENPLDAVRLGGRKLYYLLNDRDISDNIDFYAVEEVNPVLRWLPVRFGVLLALAIPGLFVLRRDRGGALLLLYGLAAALPPLLFFVVGRFRLPLLPVLAVGAAAGLLQITTGLRRRRREVVIPLAVVSAALVFVHGSLFDVREDRTWHYHYLNGDVLFRRGDRTGAIQAFEESLRRNDRIPLTRNALGFLYAEEGSRLDRAETLIRGAIELEPARRRFYLDSLGRVLFRKGEMESAAVALKEAISLFVDGEEYSKAEALRHLAEVRAAQGRAAEADSLRREAARVLP